VEAPVVESRSVVMRRLALASAMATTGDLQRAAEFLEWARDIRRGKREARQGWRGRRYTRASGQS
jgi:hypothetical protein